MGESFNSQCVFWLCVSMCECVQVREYLNRIRDEFESLLAENESKPESERLPRSAFEIDVGLREMVAQVCVCVCVCVCPAFTLLPFSSLPYSDFTYNLTRGLCLTVCVCVCVCVSLSTQETARREEEARKELAWETEKRRLALSKLKSFFLDNVRPVTHTHTHTWRCHGPAGVIS